MLFPAFLLDFVTFILKMQKVVYSKIKLNKEAKIIFDKGGNKIFHFLIPKELNMNSLV